MRRSFQVLGERTRVSQAATVNEHTKKYLWAERWGGSLRESGRRPKRDFVVSVEKEREGGLLWTH